MNARFCRRFVGSISFAGRLVVWGADGLGFGGASLAEVDREDSHRPHGEELGLPVLECLLPEVRYAHVADPPKFREVVCGALIVVGAPVAERLSGP